MFKINCEKGCQTPEMNNNSEETDEDYYTYEEPYFKENDEYYYQLEEYAEYDYSEDYAG